jgi:hypothetical protein
LIADNPPNNQPTADSTTAIVKGLPVAVNHEPPPQPQHGGKTPCTIQTNTVAIHVKQTIYVVFDQ